MSITSLSSAPITEKTVADNDLATTIKKNMGKSLKYQIIDKMLVTKNTDKWSENSLVKYKDSISLSSSSISKAQLNNEKNLDQGVISEQVFMQGSASRLSFSSEVTEEPVNKTDPLAFDLNGNGIETTGVNQGILFDINGDGNKEQSSFISGGDAFLAYDKNGNGVIDNGKELFGDQNGARNGFEELSKYDDNKDGKIDKKDAIYASLKLVSIDKNSKNGQSLKTSSLADNKIQSINLAYQNIGYQNQQQAINRYDTIEQVGQFKRTDGSKGLVADILVGNRTTL